MSNWIELKDWAIENKLDIVIEKMNELESLDYFLAYTDNDGYDLIMSNTQDGIAVWTEEQSNSKFKLKVKKSAIFYYDDKDKFYDCDINGIEIIETLK
ncbi:hypothetical protein [Paenibacillus sp. LK1]|uniref:hypothetical protein n=1 Tax=Paenibacillus sp. LK1 TaxID=2053014 RepID=UPI000C1757C9|nr:hypothetical protein [Paenibacillus sp. LK1]PIH59061.1 hypothetical protein CS562_14050 [Paenibacillus sp. LK1]